MVKIIDEMIQGRDALLEAALDPAPLGGGDDSRHEVEREDLLQARMLAIDIEGNPHLQERGLSGSLPIEQLAFRKLLDIGQQRPRGGSRLSVFPEHFVEKFADFVTLKSHEKSFADQLWFDRYGDGFQ